MSAFAAFSRVNSSPSSVILETSNTVTPPKSSGQQKKRAAEKKAQSAAFSMLASVDRSSAPIANKLHKKQLRKVQLKPSCKPRVLFRSIGMPTANAVSSEVDYKRRREPSNGATSKKAVKLLTGAKVMSSKKSLVNQRKKTSFKASSKRRREKKSVLLQVSGVVVPQPKEAVKVTVKRANTITGPKYDLTERLPATLISPFDMRRGAVGLRKQALLQQAEKTMRAVRLQREIQQRKLQLLAQMQRPVLPSEIEALTRQMERLSIC
jgi:hypothetical protein